MSNKPENSMLPPKKGYKKTKLGWIPEEWGVKTLGEFVNIISGISPSNYRLKKEGDYPFLKVEDLNNSEKFQVHSRHYSNDKKNIIPKFSIIFPKRGAAILNNKVRINEVPVLMDSNLMAIFPKNSLLYNEYLYYRITHEKLYRIADTSTIPQINNKHIIPYKIPLPPLPEQRAIAACLGTWDRAIETIQRLIEQKQLRKKWLMQNLLTGKKRLPGFDGEWKEVKLGEVGVFSKGKGINKSDLIPNGQPCIRYGELYTNHHFKVKHFDSFIPENIAIHSKRVKKGDILFAGSGETIEEIGKSVAYLKEEVAYAGGDVIIFSTNNSVDAECLSYILETDFVKIQKRKFGQGYSVVHIYSRDLKKLSILLPPLPEQTAIARVLQAADREIELLQAKLEKLKAQKKGLMQQLLTGKKRLNLKEKDLSTN